MKKIFTLILCLLIAGSVCADDYLYLEDIEVERGQSVLIPVKAHFDNWVSVWQVDISVPDGVDLRGYNICDDFAIQHYNGNGDYVTYNPMFAVGMQGTRYLMLSMERDYDADGNFLGVCKFSPNDYVMWEIELAISNTCNGGDIIVESTVACGADKRPEVTRANETSTHAATIRVNGTGEEQYGNGYWIVMDDMPLEIDKNDEIEVWFPKHIELANYHYIVNGKQYGAPSFDQPTNLNDLTLNPLIKNSEYDYTLIGSGNTYTIELVERNNDELFVHCVRKSGADKVDEAYTNKEVKDVRYYNVAGQEMRKPNGFTIVVTTYTDGTIKTDKILN